MMCAPLHVSLAAALTFLFLTSSSLDAAAVDDLCSNTESIDKLLQYFHQSATPKGGVSAGTYSKDTDAETLLDCIASCCDSVSCGTIFFHQDTCYLIECNVSVADSCKPLQRTEDRYKDTYLVNIRNTVTAPRLKPATVSPGSGQGLAVEQCDIETNAGCAAHQTCQLAFDGNTINYMCQCDEEFVYDPISKSCHDKLSTTVAEDYATKLLGGSGPRIGAASSVRDRSCEAGLDGQCKTHEICRPKNQRARSGSCQCENGFNRDKSTGDCKQRAVTTTINSPTTATETTTVAMPKSAQKIGISPVASTSYPLVPLVVSAGDSQQIQLPQNEASLSAYFIQKDQKGKYQYHWSVVSHPTEEDGQSFGEMAGINTASLKLSELKAGLYTFMVAVTGKNEYGEAQVNVTVLPLARTNEAPKAQIKPTSQEVNQPNDVVFDGSGSEDDDNIVSYHWEQVSGPLDSKPISDDNKAKPMLVLKGMQPGTYRFKLTVTDSDGIQNSTFANVTVIKETDYPPKANAGSNAIISLPQTSVTLYGNASTDDKGIVSYEWIKKSDSDKLTGDMTGVRQPVLHLEHLSVGDYTFTLKVTDTSGQVSTADVHVFVKPEHNKPPVAVVGKDRTIWLPMDTITLDGTNSTDDEKIMSYSWVQVSGSPGVQLENADRAVATASHLALGVHKFRLTVKDSEDKQSIATQTITVEQKETNPPVVHAGGSQVLSLPVSLVSLDGSTSTDDHGIVSYLWTRDDKSLAAGDIVNQTDHTAVLQLTNLVAGRYVFTLKVTDTEGLSSTDTASLIIRPQEYQDDLVELKLNTRLGTFTQANKVSLENQLSLLLHKSAVDGDISVHIERLSQDSSSGHVLVTFYATLGPGTITMPGTHVVATLKKQFHSNSDVLDFQALLIDTLVCQNNCSGHGHCNQVTKMCVCEAFWMESPITAYLGTRLSNCEWSVLYVIIIAFVSVVAFGGIAWGFTFLCKRWYSWKPKKRHRYTLLEEMDDYEGDKVKDNIELIPKGKIQSTSIMLSESDFSSDEETLFINKKTTKLNGHASRPPNGVVKPKATGNIKT